MKGLFHSEMKLTLLHMLLCKKFLTKVWKNRMKKSNWLIRSLVVVSCMSLLLAAGCTSSKQQADDHKFKLGIVADVGSFSDESFNQAGLEGCKKCEKELDVSLKSLESTRDADYVRNLTLLARDSYDLVWAIGFKFMNAIPEVAKKFPNNKFGIIDSDLGGNIPKT